MIFLNRGKGLAAIVAAALVIVCCCAQSLHAALYAFAQQNTGTYTITGASVGTFSPNTHSSAAQDAVPSGSDAHAGIADVLQSYVGPGGGKPAENSFVPKGLTTPDYSRGDALVTLAPSLTTNNVAELYLTGPNNSSATGAWAGSAPLTLSTSSAVSVSFSFSNLLNVTNDGLVAGTVQAAYSYIMSIQNAAGATVFSSSPTALNQTASLLSAGTINLPGAGTVTITSGTLASGSYTLSLAGTETVFANVVPEPGLCSVLMAFSILARRGTRR